MTRKRTDGLTDYQRGRIALDQMRQARAPLGMPKPKPAAPTWPRTGIDDTIRCLDAGVVVPLDTLVICQEYVARFGGQPHPDFRKTKRLRDRWAAMVGMVERAIADAWERAA